MATFALIEEIAIHYFSTPQANLTPTTDTEYALWLRQGSCTPLIQHALTITSEAVVKHHDSTAR